MADITKHTMLVLQSISMWTARRHDRKISNEVAEKHHAKVERAGRYNKMLIDVKHDLYVALVKISGEARRYHEDKTLPWAQDGSRILSAAIYMDYMAAMEGFREQWQHAVEQFLRAYPALREAAKKELNGLYKDSDYPSASQLREKFGFRISVYPVPNAEDFRVDSLDETEVKAIRESIEEEVRVTVLRAEQERWVRLFDVVKHAVERLSKPDAIFRDTLITNIREACQTLPKLALVKDADFDAFVEQVSRNLANAEPSILREEPQYRAETARKAAEIARKMAAFMPQQ